MPGTMLLLETQCLLVHTHPSIEEMDIEQISTLVDTESQQERRAQKESSLVLGEHFTKNLD